MSQTATYRATKSDQITIRVIWDDQDPSNPGWAYQVYDASAPGRMDALVESGAVDGRQTSTRPSRGRVLRSAGVQGGRYVRVIYE